MRLPALALLAMLPACAAAGSQQPLASAAAAGMTILGPADYCGSAALLRLNDGERITDLGATGLHGRVFTFTSGGRSVSVTETDIARPLAGEVVRRGEEGEVVRVRSRGGKFLYAVQAPDGRHVRLECGQFTGGEEDLPLVLRFALRTYEAGETCNDPAAIL